MWTFDTLEPWYFDFGSRTGLFDMTTAVALEHVIFRELLGLSGLGVTFSCHPSPTSTHCHVCAESPKKKLACKTAKWTEK